MGSRRGRPFGGVTATTALLLLTPLIPLAPLTSTSWADPTPTPTASAPAAPGARITCTITDPRISEASGLAVSDDNLYVVNDGGTRVSVFVLDRHCRMLRVVGGDTDPFDVEDLARAPDGTLWLADTGDNRASRDSVAVETLAQDGASALYRFTYPDGPHDAEALLLGAHDRPYLVTKNPLGISAVYTPVRTPSVASPVPLRRVTTLRFRFTGTPGGPVGAVSQLLVTGGAVSADGTRIALRTYTDLYLWTVRRGDIGAALRDGDPTRVPLPAEQQGESVAFTPDGTAVLTTSEGSPAPVHAVALPPASDRPSTTRPARSTATPSPSAVVRSVTPSADRGSRPVYVNLILAAVIATIIVVGLGRLRRK